MKEGNIARMKEKERKREKRISERMRASYTEIVFLQFKFECKKKEEKTRREKLWGASEWSHGGQLRQSHSTNMTCT